MVTGTSLPFMLSLVLLVEARKAQGWAGGGRGLIGSRQGQLLLVTIHVTYPKAQIIFFFSSKIQAHMSSMNYLKTFKNLFVYSSLTRHFHFPFREITSMKKLKM